MIAIHAGFISGVMLGFELQEYEEVTSLIVDLFIIRLTFDYYRV